MKIDIDIIITAMIMLFFIDMILVLRLLINKAVAGTTIEEADRTQKKLLSQWTVNKTKSRETHYIEDISFLKQNVRFDVNNSDAPAKISRETRIFRPNQKKMKSIFRLKRIKSAVNLGAIGTQKARNALEKALMKEKNVSVRLYIAYALSDIHDDGSIQVLVESLLNSKRWYRDKVNMLIAEYGNHLLPLLPSLMERKEIEIKELIVDYSSIFISGELKQYLFTLIDNLEDEKKRLTCESGCSEKKNAAAAVNMEEKS